MDHQSFPVPLVTSDELFCFCINQIIHYIGIYNLPFAGSKHKHLQKDSTHHIVWYIWDPRYMEGFSVISRNMQHTSVNFLVVFPFRLKK